MRIEGDLSSHSLETPEHFLPSIELFSGADKVAKKYLVLTDLFKFGGSPWTIALIENLTSSNC